MQKCRCVLTVWHLFTVGRGTGRKKINLRQSPVMKRERGGSETEQGRVQGTGSAGPRQGPRVPSVVPLFTHREISYNFTAPLSAAIEKGQIPSWLLTLCPVRVVAIMGKSKPLASTVGYLSSPAPQPQSKQQPRVMSVKSVCA